MARNTYGYPMVEKYHQQQKNHTATTSTEKHNSKPMNAFLIWSKIQRRKIALHTPTVNSSQISKRLKAEWRLLTKVEKRSFFDEAQRLKATYMKKHLDYHRRRGKTPKSPIFQQQLNASSMQFPNFQSPYSLPVDALSYPYFNPAFNLTKMTTPNQHAVVTSLLSPSYQNETRNHTVKTHMELFPALPVMYPGSTGPICLISSPVSSQLTTSDLEV